MPVSQRTETLESQWSESLLLIKIQVNMICIVCISHYVKHLASAPSDMEMVVCFQGG